MIHKYPLLSLCHFQNNDVQNSFIKNQDVLFIVDGKKINQNNFKKIDPKRQTRIT